MVNLRDLLTGGALFALGALMAIMARGFPSIGAVVYGPGLFPTIIACGLMTSGLAIAAEARTAPRGDGDTSPAAPRRLLPMAGVIAVIAFFALALDPLGFHVAAAISLLVSVRLFRGGWITAILVAGLGPVLLHFLFYSVMRVPLPWGLLLPVAW